MQLFYQKTILIKDIFNYFITYANNVWAILLE